MTMLTKEELDELEPQRWGHLPNAEIGVIARTWLPKLLEEHKLLKGAMAADDERLRIAERMVWDYGKTWGCDAPEQFADMILSLRERVERLEAREIQLLEANTAEVERRRIAESQEKIAVRALEEQILLTHKLRKKLIEARHFFSVGGLREPIDE